MTIYCHILQCIVTNVLYRSLNILQYILKIGSQVLNLQFYVSPCTVDCVYHSSTTCFVCCQCCALFAPLCNLSLVSGKARPLALDMPRYYDAVPFGSIAYCA